eukprot:scaffold1223_cov105-Skeletonema_dohrnii-CCMP3373.AAC.4
MVSHRCNRRCPSRKVRHTIHHLNSNSPCTNSDASYPQQQFRESSNFSTGIPKHRAALSVSHKNLQGRNKKRDGLLSLLTPCLGYAIQE